MSRQTYICDVARTPHGSFFGALKHISAPELGGLAIHALLDRHPGLGKDVDSVYMGQVFTAGVGQHPARQAGLWAGLPHNCHAENFNKVCASSLAALIHAHHRIQVGEAERMIAGGMESMSRAPYLVHRSKKVSGDRSILMLLHEDLAWPDSIARDSMLYDGLTEPSAPGRPSMGMIADTCAREESLSRDLQEGYAHESTRRAIQAWQAGHFADYVTPIATSDGVVLSSDEGLRQPDLQKMRDSKPAFSADGTVTAATSSKIADGASAILLASGFALGMDKSLRPIARIVASATFSDVPLRFPTAPIGAIEAVLKRAGQCLGDVDLFEINEAFAVVPLAAMQKLQIPHEKVNVWGGAIAIGHPLGASGTRIVGTLALQLRALGKKRGIAVACNGGGEAVAVLIEAV